MKKFLLLFLGVQSKFSFFTTLLVKGSFVGVDQYKNKYYTGKARKHYNHERRWVVYKNGDPEASQVPPEFHGWLHHQTDIFPDSDHSPYRQPWQKPHTQNLTGTDLAYRPNNGITTTGRAPVTGDYEAWRPE